MADYERTEPATPKKREEARKKGQVPQSGDLPVAFILGAGLLVLYFLGGAAVQRMGLLMKEVLGNLHSLGINGTLALLVAEHFSYIFAPFAVGVAVAAVSANVIQKGFLLTAEPLAPQLSRINPIEGFKRLFSLNAIVEFIKSSIKVLIVAAVGYWAIKGELPLSPELVTLDIHDLFSHLGKASFGLLLKATLAFCAVALLDALYQRWDYERKLRMSRQEVKDEWKQREGDPQIKARLRALQRQFARQRMMERVKEADVVITNPVRLAIALKYTRGKMAAPMVVAKGRGWIAKRIREIALAHGVPIVQNKPLAEILYRTVQIGQMIPVELYRAVAEILAYVYRLKGRRL
ncbi:MAG TPA: flagellar biosynthesis protein FlhB [Deltaproteobacteria bacterium]|nr:flagellar biosynthesis protein FlhB [Deltaproteobacteria bacterium]